MTATCLRCDRVGDSASASCPACGAPLYRSAPPRRASQDRTLPANVSLEAGEERAPSEARSVTTSSRSVFATVGTVFCVILVLLSRGGPHQGPSRDAAGVRPEGQTGILVYATAVGGGSARLWRWNLASGEVQRGPLIADPVELVTIGSPSFGWLGITSDRGHGVLEASVLDSLELEAEPKRLGRGTIVTWARPGDATGWMPSHGLGVRRARGSSRAGARAARDPLRRRPLRRPDQRRALAHQARIERGGRGRRGVP